MLEVKDGCTVIRFIFRKTNLLSIENELQILMRNDDVKDGISQKVMDKMKVVCRKRNVVYCQEGSALALSVLGYWGW